MPATGAGKRYDIVSCFARLTKTVVADPAPLAPARYAAHVRASVPLIDDPGYVPALRAPLRRARRAARCCRSPTSTSRCSRGPARTGACRRSCPRAEVARATYDKYEAHLLLERLGLPSPPTVLPERRPRRARIPGDGQAASRLGRALDPSRRTIPQQARFFVDYVREPTMVQRAMGGPELSIDCLGDRDGRCLNAIPRTMLESRGGESIKGQVIHDEELIELGRRVDGDAGGVRAGDDPGVSRPRASGSAITDVNTRFGGAFPAPVLRGAARPHLPRADRRAWRPASASRPHVGEFRAG